MTAKTSNLLNILVAFGMIAAGIIAIYDEEMLFTAIGIYFIFKGFFVTSLMQHIQKSINSKCYSTITKSYSLSKA